MLTLALLLERWVDLTDRAGGRVEVRVENHATDWSNEYAYWGAVEVVID